MMICDQVREDLELYALGALERAEADTVAEHLATGCPICHQALQSALRQNVLVSRSLPLVEPSARLRRRIQNAIAPDSAPRRQWFPWAIAAAACLLLLAAGVTFETRLQLAHSTDQARLSSTLQILGAPGTRAVSFNDPKLQQLHGTLYIHQKLGLALIIDHLPAAPAGWKYESWLVPKTGAPEPVEPFHPDTAGRAVSLVPGPLEVIGLAAVAVSLEPQNSHPTKPTTLVFAAKL